MIERITYGERKTHKLTFLFLFFYCHFYFAVTKEYSYTLKVGYGMQLLHLLFEYL